MPRSPCSRLAPLSVLAAVGLTAMTLLAVGCVGGGSSGQPAAQNEPPVVSTVESAGPPRNLSQEEVVGILRDLGVPSSEITSSPGEIIVKPEAGAGLAQVTNDGIQWIWFDETVVSSLVVGAGVHKGEQVVVPSPSLDGGCGYEAMPSDKIFVIGDALNNNCDPPSSAPWDRARQIFEAIAAAAQGGPATTASVVSEPPATPPGPPSQAVPDPAPAAGYADDGSSGVEAQVKGWVHGARGVTCVPLGTPEWDWECHVRSPSQLSIFVRTDSKGVISRIALDHTGG